MSRDDVSVTNSPKIFEKFMAFVESDSFSCIGAKTASYLKTLLHRDCCFDNKVTLEDAYGFLQQFAGIRETLSKTNATFVLTFSDRDIQSEAEFEDFVWTTLTRLHELDIQAGYEWSKESSADPYSPDFGFSLIGEPFFIVGLHPYSSRISRQAPFPALVFNAHRQFRHLKVDGAFQKMQKEIRRREMKIQGTLNPNLSDFGEQSEARQYAGNATQQVWSCPFSKKINL
ncbi:hypothetical protein DMW62_16700 [Serratia marcescens]|uniref:YqcI/YcgG family protein n=1 Tax=Serratia marcescens TaxID=615 RepID=A0ABX5NKE1_SERMA|nr:MULTISPECIES: guanitoxin biosynthesis heme-dependent pre-guanitoxin N-hydroxylase GntA [Serratia]MBX9283182.1 YqcI/YcgG family protein [Serratia marcescens]MBX9285041.1 YqcI/YcgG family protein [Serratia marcescens]MBX9294436.1 YqcI/YcgG family protein [Serratia marcescens]MBX9304430.1 YqcI/YcgG family protein [Serratia marcescens]MBX9305948.1 YqcI/YcgG family protein [Serratia marcescens]